MKIQNWYDYTIDYALLAKYVRIWKVRHNLTNAEFDELIGYENVVGQLLLENRRYGTRDEKTGHINHMLMRTYFNICELIEMHPATFISTQRRGE